MGSCTICGAQNRPDHQFCVSCGGKLEEPAVGIDRYVLEGVLGRGALSIVYRATETRTGRTVAIKALSPDLLTEPGRRQRLRDEARSLRELSHPNIVSVVEYLETDSVVWLVTECVEGASLRSVLMHSHQLEPEQALSIFTGLLAGLAHAHERGLVHGDLKPENVLVDSSGTAKLADFGQAVPVGQAPTGGTAAYMSPEAVRGEPATPLADIYSVGALLYETLTGRPPFLGASEQAILRLQLTEPPPPIVGLAPGIALLLSALLDKDPLRRPQSAGAALDFFETAVRHAMAPNGAAELASEISSRRRPLAFRRCRSESEAQWSAQPTVRDAALAVPTTDQDKAHLAPGGSESRVHRPVPGPCAVAGCSQSSPSQFLWQRQL